MFFQNALISETLIDMADVCTLIISFDEDMMKQITNAMRIRWLSSRAFTDAENEKNIYIQDAS